MALDSLLITTLNFYNKLGITECLYIIEAHYKLKLSKNLMKWLWRATIIESFEYV